MKVAQDTPYAQQVRKQIENIVHFLHDSPVECVRRVSSGSDGGHFHDHVCIKCFILYVQIAEWEDKFVNKFEK